MRVDGVGIGDYLALKQVKLQAQVSTRVMKSALDVAKQQGQEIVDLLSQGVKGSRVNVKA